MGVMSDFEIRANNIETAEQRVTDFGYSYDSPKETVSRVVGMFVIWLTSCEEARHQSTSANASFIRNVINQLPVQDYPN